MEEKVEKIQPFSIFVSTFHKQKINWREDKNIFLGKLNFDFCLILVREFKLETILTERSYPYFKKLDMILSKNWRKNKEKKQN